MRKWWLARSEAVILKDPSNKCTLTFLLALSETFCLLDPDPIIFPNNQNVKSCGWKKLNDTRPLEQVRFVQLNLARWKIFNVGSAFFIGSSHAPWKGTPVHRLFSANYPIYLLTFNMTHNAAVCFLVFGQKILKVHFLKTQTGELQN